MGSRPIQVLRHSRSQPFARPLDVGAPAIYIVEKPRRYFGIACVFRLVSHPDRLTPFQQDGRVLTLAQTGVKSVMLHGIARAADRANDILHVGEVERLAQASHMDVYRALINIDVVAPDAVQELGAGEDTTR